MLVELWKCPICGAETPRPAYQPDIDGFPQDIKHRLIDVAKFADTRPFYDSKASIEKCGLILGVYGSGKTTLQLWMMGYFFSNAFNHGDKICQSQYGKEYLVLLRGARHTFEYLAICDVAPVRVFVPSGCVYNYEHPNLELIEFDVNNYGEIFEKLKRNRINVVAVDSYLPEPDQRYEWWGRFVYALLDWKSQPQNIDDKMLFCVDEIGSMVPNRGESETKSHAYWGNRIREDFDAFRRNNIKILATTHTITDIKLRFRSNFPYWWIKRTTAESVPGRYRNFGERVIEKLEQKEVFLKDMKGNFHCTLSPAWVFSRKIGVVTTPSEELNEVETLEQKWRKMYFELLDFCLDNKKVARKELMTIHSKKRPAIDMMIFRHREEKQMSEEQEEHVNTYDRAAEENDGNHPAKAENSL